jgi:beta-phosphoglucomutase family hydrolase
MVFFLHLPEDKNSMENRKIAAIFDMDGVIVNNDVYHFSAWEELCRNYGLNVGSDEVKSWFGNTNRMIIRNLFGNSIDNETIERMGAEKEVIYREMYEPHIKPLHGLIPFLEDLQQSGIIIAIATSAPTENVDFVLDHTGIRAFFSIIIDASMINEGKPSPEIYLKAAEVLEVNVMECLVFEDSFHGIESANRAGMKVIGVATTHQAVNLKGTIKNIPDFTSINAMELIQIIRNQ